MQIQRKLAIGGAIVGAMASFLAIDALVGRPARLVDLVGFFAVAFGAGVALALAVRDKR